MPDWSYRTVLRPLLFRLSPPTARRLSLGSMGALGRVPGGSRVIELFGHMRPSPRLASTRAGIAFPTPVGLGCPIDPQGRAAHALSQFGVAFVEVGPVRPRPMAAPFELELDLEREAMDLPDPHPSDGLDAMAGR